MLTQSATQYLEGRGYTPALLAFEDIRSVTGRTEIEGISIGDGPERIAWISRTASGRLAGVQTRELGEKKYRWYAAPNTSYLPPLYGSDQDHQLLWETGEVILAEGIFDRVAMKRLIPGKAVYARLSKGTSRQLVRHLSRVAKIAWLAFDEDGPGSEGAEMAEQRLHERMQVYRLRYPAKDPSELWAKRGIAAARNLVMQIHALGDD